MTHELEMSLTQYLQIKDKLVPKHLTANEQQRKRDIIRKQVLAESPFEIIQKAKEKFLRPIGQIQTIMRHFDSKFGHRRMRLETTLSRPVRRQRAGSTMTESSPQEKDLESKMRYLISLPTIGRVKEQAEQYRRAVNADAIKEREDRKNKIVSQFGNYMQAELKGNPLPSLQRRVKTIQ